MIETDCGVRSAAPVRLRLLLTLASPLGVARSVGADGPMTCNRDVPSGSTDVSAVKSCGHTELASVEPAENWAAADAGGLITTDGNFAPL